MVLDVNVLKSLFKNSIILELEDKNKQDYMVRVSEAHIRDWYRQSHGGVFSSEDGR